MEVVRIFEVLAGDFLLGNSGRDQAEQLQLANLLQMPPWFNPNRWDHPPTHLWHCSDFCPHARCLFLRRAIIVRCWTCRAVRMESPPTPACPTTVACPNQQESEVQRLEVQKVYPQGQIHRKNANLFCDSSLHFSTVALQNCDPVLWTTGTTVIGKAPLLQQLA